MVRVSFFSFTTAVCVSSWADWSMGVQVTLVPSPLHLYVTYEENWELLNLSKKGIDKWSVIYNYCSLWWCIHSVSFSCIQFLRGAAYTIEFDPGIRKYSCLYLPLASLMIVKWKQWRSCPFFSCIFSFRRIALLDSRNQHAHHLRHCKVIENGEIYRRLWRKL